MNTLADLMSSTPSHVWEAIQKRFRVKVTDHLLETLSQSKDSEALRRQFIPDPAELQVLAAERADPIGDTAHSPVKGIVHRYPDRCLLMPLLVCPAYCRFCFRREKVGKKAESLTPEELDAAIAYIESHPEIIEVILTGGEPLLLKPEKLALLMRRLNAITHVDVIRIHTRSCVLEPSLITQQKVNALKSSKAVYVVLHTNHAAELTSETLLACSKFIDAGIPMLSQTVLLKGINNSIEALSDLMHALVKNRIKPYYLHHPDLAEGTGHFRVSIAEGQALVRALRGRYSGLCQPTYVLDLPGGYGKVPLCPSYIQSSQESDQKYEVEDYLGNLHDYVEVL